MLDQNSMAPATPPADRSTLHLSWLQPPGLIALSFTNAFLRLVTFGIYSFWGKTEVRKRIWSAVRIEGEPLQYSGTGRELFMGFLVIFGVVLIPIMLSSFAVAVLSGPQSPAMLIFQIVLYVVIFLLIGIGTYRAQRYRLSRTSWRGIRGGMEGSDIHYAWTYFWSALVLPMTWGWLTPWRSTELQKILTRDMRFGDRAFTFTAKPGPLYGRFATLWFGSLFIIIIAITVLGLSIDTSMIKPEALSEDQKTPADVVKIIALIYGVLILAYFCYYVFSAWYRSKAISHFAAHTHFEGATFHSNVTGAGLVWIAIGNLLLNILGWIIGFAVAAALIAPLIMMAPGGPEAAGSETIKFAATVIFALVLVASSGLFSPIIQARTMRYLVGNLSITGGVPLGDIAQGAAQKHARGEGLAQAFDIDGF